MNFVQSQKRYKKFISLRKKGFTLIKIAKIFSISKQAVGERIRKGTPKCRGFYFDKHVFESCGLEASKISGRERTRMLVRIRDKFKCQSCFKKLLPVEARNLGKRLFDIHHLNGLCGKKSRSYDKISDMDGLITLCHKCHFNRHDFSQKKLSPDF